VNKQVLDEYIIYDEQTQTYSMDPEQAVRDDVEKNHWKNTVKTILKDWRLYLMLVPLLFVFFCWRYLPMYELLGAFKFSNPSLDVSDQQYVGFYYFAKLIAGDMAPEFWAAFRNTFLLSFYGLCFGFPMPIIVALFFNEIKSNILRSAFQVMTYLPKFMSTVVMTTLTIMLLKQSDLVSGMGVVSNLLVKLGLISEEVGASGLLNGPQYFRAIYQITGIWEGAGYDSIVYFAAIIAISPTSYEAAQIDGAGKMAQMKYVVLPCILSTVVIMLINRIGSLLSVGYEKVLLLTQGSTSSTIYSVAEVVSTWAYKQGMSSSGAGGGQPGLASAAEMLNNVTGMILVIGANTIARKATDVSLY